MPAIGSGLSSQIGYSTATSTYGAYVAPTKFVRGRMYQVTRAAQRVQGEGITSGYLAPYANHYVETTEAATAKIDFDVPTRNIGTLLQAITGGTSVATTATTGSNTQTHTIGDTFGKSLTFQAGAPTRSGTVVPQTLTGGVITSAKFSCDATGLLTCSIDIDGQKFSTTQTLAVATYVDTDVFHGRQATLKMGAKGAEAAVSGVRSVSVSITRSIDAADYTFGAQGLKAQPVLNGLYEISGSIEADFLDPATFQALALGMTSTSLVWEFVGDKDIAGATGTKPKITFNLPTVFFSGDAQGVDGVKELTGRYDFSHKFNGTDIPSIVTVSADTSL